MGMWSGETARGEEVGYSFEMFRARNESDIDARFRCMKKASKGKIVRLSCGRATRISRKLSLGFAGETALYYI